MPPTATSPTSAHWMAQLPQPPSNLAKAHFATTSRLLACLVTERLLDALVFPSGSAPSRGSNGAVASCFVIDSSRGARPTDNHSQSQGWENVVAVFWMSNMPVLRKENVETVWKDGVGEGMSEYYPRTKVALLDPADIIYPIYTIKKDEQKVSKFKDFTTFWNGEPNNASVGIPRLEVADTLLLWQSVTTTLNINTKIAQEIGMELQSSIEHQEYAYKHRKPTPTLASSSIQWEQSIVEGHATHPMHRARHAIDPIPLLDPTTPLDIIGLRFIAFPRSHLLFRGPFENILAPLTKYLLLDSQISLHPNMILIPVHPLQLPNIVYHFPYAVILPPSFSVGAQSLASLRSVVLDNPDLLPGHSFKLSLGIKVSSALRTISPYSAYVGPGLSRDVLPRLAVDREALWIEKEVASCVVNCEDSDVAKHCSCIVRELLEGEDEARLKGERVVVCAALTEKCNDNGDEMSVVEKVWKLDTKHKRVAFLENYVFLIVRAFLPPCLQNGFAFGAHGQNVLARFDRETGRLRGFIVRDFGGIKLHQETLERSCGIKADVLLGSSTVASDISEVYNLLHHTLIHCHLHRLIRALRLHHCGIGWRIVRRELRRMIPRNHPMWNAWMQKEQIYGKCFVRMKVMELYRHYIYMPIPNLIHYRSEKEGVQVEEADASGQSPVL